MDDQEAIGQLESVGDEVTFIQQSRSLVCAYRLHLFYRQCGADPEALGDGSPSGFGDHRSVGCAGHREGCSGPGSLDAGLRASALNLQTPAVVPAHPAALTLALLLGQVRQATAVRDAFATILEPASEYGRGAMDELHQQTVSLLSFQSLPKALYDMQVAFNAVPAAGPEGKIDLQATEARVRRHYALLAAGKLPPAAIQLVHAPVFHGHTLSLGLDVERPMTAEQLRQLLAASEHIEVSTSDEDAPSNLSAAGQEQVLVRVRSAEDEATATNRFWLWAAADNLKLAATNAVACALEMRRLRPQGQVQ